MEDQNIICGAAHPTAPGVACIRASGVCVEQHLGRSAEGKTDFYLWPVDGADDEFAAIIHKLDLDLGQGHFLGFFRWSPDREINPQYAGLPDVEKIGGMILHTNLKTGGVCRSAINFDGEVSRQVFPERSRWQVESFDPLTISPSVLCMACGDHGFIREGKWVKA